MKRDKSSLTYDDFFRSVSDILEKRSLLIILFVFSTVFFIFQYTTELSWDFTVYLMNAKYFLEEINFFEWARPPLPSFLMSLFSVFGWKVSPIIYIIFTSFLFLFSSVKLASSFGFNENLFYLISLSPYVLIYGTFIGTELLAFSLIELFLAYFKEGRERIAAIFLGLSTLVRYPNIIFLSLLAFHKKPKKIFVSFLLVGLIWVPWLTFNYIKSGSPLTSFLDSYALNISNRNNNFYLDFRNFLLIGLLFPTFILGLSRFEVKNKFHWIFLLIFSLSLFSYLNVPVKVERYLFNFSLPLIFFSSLYLEGKLNKKMMLMLFISSLFFSLFLFNLRDYGYGGSGRNLEKIIEGMEKCRTKSNNWVFLNHLGFTTEPSPWKTKVSEDIGEGVRILFFKNISDPAYVQNQTFLSEFPVIKDGDYYILLGYPDVCLDQIPATKTYIERFEENTGEKLSTCEIILGNFICDFMDHNQNLDISIR
ncbi:MAG: hypothetical protein GF368_05235 [Candidatus Aenigmarchaeota archaeon]|nr:hypothetical protein [Candidatus Aenigmarchaeota archaeon]